MGGGSWHVLSRAYSVRMRKEPKRVFAPQGDMERSKCVGVRIEDSYRYNERAGRCLPSTVLGFYIPYQGVRFIIKSARR